MWLRSFSVYPAEESLYVRLVVLEQPTDELSFVSDMACFTFRAESFPPPSYQWQKLSASGFNNIENETEESLVFSDLSWSQHHNNIISRVYEQLGFIHHTSTKPPVSLYQWGQRCYTSHLSDHKLHTPLNSGDHSLLKTSNYWKSSVEGHQLYSKMSILLTTEQSMVCCS